MRKFEKIWIWMYIYIYIFVGFWIIEKILDGIY